MNNATNRKHNQNWISFALLTLGVLCTQTPLPIGKLCKALPCTYIWWRRKILQSPNRFAFVQKGPGRFKKLFFLPFSQYFPLRWSVFVIFSFVFSPRYFILLFFSSASDFFNGGLLHFLTYNYILLLNFVFV